MYCELEDISLKVDLKKCACIRIAKDLMPIVNRYSTAHEQIAFIEQLRYLGVYIRTGHALKFKINTDSSNGYYMDA